MQNKRKNTFYLKKINYTTYPDIIIVEKITSSQISTLDILKSTKFSFGIIQEYFRCVVS